MKKLNSAILLGAAVIALSTVTFADDDDAVDASAATVGIDQAISIATAEVPGTVVGTELESEDGKLVWEVVIAGADKMQFEVEIDATTGAVLEVEEDDD